jgi:hypothetical protein
MEFVVIVVIEVVVVAGKYAAAETTAREFRKAVAG